MKAAKQEALRAKAGQVYKRLEKTYPDASCALVFSNPLELLIATILSAQCTDVRVNEVTKVLFKTMRSPTDYLKSSQSTLEKIIRSTGFFRQKAKNIQAAVQRIVEHHAGEVPRTMEELTALPGVGRKTANVVLGNAFQLPGLPVDTHVRRVSNRIGLTINSDPVKIESDLSGLLPEKNWCMLSHLLIFHGRQTCKARKPLCEQCPLTDICEYYLKLRKKG